MTFLYFNGNSETPLPGDRISIVKPLLDYFLPKFQYIYWIEYIYIYIQYIYIYWVYIYIYIPKQELDEAVIKWRGSKTYNPGKLTKLGILVRKFSESESWIYMQPWDSHRYNKETVGNSIIGPTTLSWFLALYLPRQLLYYNSVSIWNIVEN